jgi:hypothetical protein
MVLSAKLKLDTTEFTAPLAAAAVSSSKVAQSIGQIDPARAARAAEAFRRLSIDAASGRVQLNGTSDALLGVSDLADKAASSMGRAVEQTRLLGLQTHQIRQLSVALGGMALNVAGSALQAYGHDTEAGYLRAIGAGALSGAMVGGMTFGPQGAAVGSVIGGASGGANQYFGNKRTDEEQNERLRQSLENIKIGGESAKRAIADLDSASEATATLKKMREEVEKLKAQLAKNLDSGDWPVTRLNMMSSLLDQVSAKESALRASENDSKQNAEQLNRSMTIGQSRDTLAAFKSSQADAESRQVFDQSFNSASTTAERVALVKSRMDEFGESAAKLSEILESTTTQADPEAFAAALKSLSTVANEVTRLKGLDTKVKAGPLLPSEHAAAIPSDSLSRIGIFVGGANNRMESLAERTARATQQSERHLRLIATKPAGRLVWN